MSFRDDWTISILLNLAAALLYRLFVHPWLEALIRAVRARTLWSWVRARRMRNRVTVLPLSGSSISMTIGKGALTAPVASPDLPPGTASALVMAMQDPPPRPQFLNTSTMQQWEAYQRHHDLQARFAIDSTMPRFNPALFQQPPSAPTAFTLN